MADQGIAEVPAHARTAGQAGAARRATGAWRRPGLPWLLVLGVAIVGTWAYTLLIYQPTLTRARIAGGDLYGPYRSDLYPRWEGTRALLWEGRDPYSAGVTADIQRGFYGRPLTPADVMQDQQGFAYPLYTVFVLAPLSALPITVVLPLYAILILALTAVSLLWWLRALGWRLPPAAQALLALLACSMYPTIRAFYLQQPSALVVAALAAASACLARRRYTAAGILLALATIKPQLSGVLILWLLAWAVSDWRRRGRILAGFAATLALLLAGAFVLVPGWPAEWLAALGAYQSYVAGTTVLELWLPTPLVQAGLAGLGLLLIVYAWRARQALPGTAPWNLTLALLCVYAVLLVPRSDSYNQLILYPAILVFLQRGAGLRALGPASRLLYWLTLGIIVAFTVLAVGLVVLWLGAQGLGDAETAARLADWWPLAWLPSIILPELLLLALARLMPAPPMGQPLPESRAALGANP